MPIQTPHPLITPLIRTVLDMPAALVRHAPQSGQLKLHTLLLRDTPLAREAKATFDDSCTLTVAEGEEATIQNLRLITPGPVRPYKGIALAVFSSAGQIALTLGGDNLRLFVGRGCTVRAQIQLSQQATCFIGDGCTMAGARIAVAHGDCSFGDDCLLADDVMVQAHELHPLYDMAAGGAMLNGVRRRLKVGRHVWLDARATLLPDTQVGDHSYVAAGSVVSGRQPANAWIAGNPAGVLREGVGWARGFGQQPPPPAQGVELPD
ncbi:MAG: acyltransferase [Proteobacteria bacterium]|nr:acyltransferase [Pseudomonadota bacterium]